MSFNYPAIEDIIRIAAHKDPVIRNLQITQCYSELSRHFTYRTGLIANWCTFATWASKQAGQTIRKEDLKHLLERRLAQDKSIAEAASRFAATTVPADGQLTADLYSFLLDVRSFESPAERASQAVGRGNKKVFEEIGYEFARFYKTCLADEAYNPNHFQEFYEHLRPGEPPEGQDYLRLAFSHYYEAMFTVDPKARAELVFLANIQIGFHEQTRLQPEIAEALDAGLNSLRFIFHLLSSLFSSHGLLEALRTILIRFIRHPAVFYRASQALIASIQALLRETITGLLMTITLPSGKVHLGSDLIASYPLSLQSLGLLELKTLLDKLDPTPDSLTGSGAYNWADLPERLHFIVDLFRSYQENQELLLPPFNPQQVEAIKTGKLPSGAL